MKGLSQKSKSEVSKVIPLCKKKYKKMAVYHATRCLATPTMFCYHFYSGDNITVKLLITSVSNYRSLLKMMYWCILV